MASPIYIVDPKTGNLRDPQLHTDQGPFLMTNWFEGQQSVNIINSQRYVFATDTNVQAVQFDLDPNSKFFFIDETKLNSANINIDAQDFYDINDLKKYSLSFLNPIVTINNYAIWSVVVCIQAEEAGTFLDELSITLDNDKPVYITIGSDCYNEDETLTGNLQNMGVEIPSSIQKAIHTTNIHEDLNNNILLNRKKRELLMNYWNVVAGKGSYKSLIDSLKWFEYGDLVRIEQYWKSDVGGKEMFMGDDLETFLDDVLENELSYKIKTTYNGLYLLLDRNKEGYDDELNPITENLDETILLWTEKDLSLKMTLLGNYFSTYFMPIHLALLHSTIERRVYAYCIQLLSASHTFRNDYFRANCPMLLTLHNNEPEFYLEDTDAYVYMDTIFGVHNSLDDLTDTEFIGVEPIREMTEYSDMLSADFSRQMFSGIGKMVQFDVEIPANWTDPNDAIWKQTIYITKNNESYKDTTSYATIRPNDDNYYNFNFNILFTEVGEYILSVSFETLNNKTYTSAIVLKVADSGTCELVPYLVERLPLIDITETAFPNEILFNNFAFRNTNEPSLTPPADYFPLEPIFVTSTHNPNHTEIGLNHYIAFIVDDEYELYNEQTSDNPCGISSIQTIANIKTDLETAFPYYFWDVKYVNDTSVDYEINTADPEPDSGPILVRGIRKPYTIDSIEQTLLNETYHFGEDTIEYSITYDIDNDNPIFTIDAQSDVSTYINGEEVQLTFTVENIDEPIEVEIIYNDISIKRTCNVLDCNSLYEYGTEPYRVHLYLNGHQITNGIIDKDVFVPILHRITPLMEPCKINQSQTVAILPTFERSFEINGDEANWRFYKRYGTRSISCIQNIAPREPFVADYEPQELDRGYWNVDYSIIQNGTNIRTIKGNSLFKVE